MQATSDKSLSKLNLQYAPVKSFQATSKADLSGAFLLHGASFDTLTIHTGIFYKILTLKSARQCHLML